jgi:addiction module HigA family antidote
MLTTKRKPASVGEILIEEFMEPMGLTQGALAEAMGVQRKHVNELCNNRRNVTAPTALILARVFGNSPDFWLNVQRRRDLWEAMHSPRERERIDRLDHDSRRVTGQVRHSLFFWTYPANHNLRALPGENLGKPLVNKEDQNCLDVASTSLRPGRQNIFLVFHSWYS